MWDSINSIADNVHAGNVVCLLPFTHTFLEENGCQKHGSGRKLLCFWLGFQDLITRIVK
jgi:hypothetical protein